MAHAIRQREYKHHAERHVAAGANLRDVMLGLNDGLVASFAVTSGVAGAFSNTPSVVIMAGLAEMLGGAVSMGLAAFISARSQIEFYESEVDRERYEIRRFPEHERDEIRGIYKQKGFSGPLLDQIVEHITGDPERWADVMMREELGFIEENFESPLKSSMVVGASYLIGAAVPVAPYLFIAPANGNHALGNHHRPGVVRGRGLEDDHHRALMVAQRAREHADRNRGRCGHLWRRPAIRRTALGAR